MYVSVSEVRNVLGVSDTSIISDAVITQAIQFAEDEIDRLTFTTYYPVEDSGVCRAMQRDEESQQQCPTRQQQVAPVPTTL